jgi:hypothetical protein
LPDGGWAPYGYRRRKDNYFVVQPQADVVRDVFARYAGGESMAAIARGLNARGTPSAQRVAWTKPSIRIMLENPHYAGLRRHGDDLVTAVWKQIVDSDTWIKVQARLAGNANRGVKATAGLYLLSGLIECGVCGRTLYHRHQARPRARSIPLSRRAGRRLLPRRRHSPNIAPSAW